MYTARLPFVATIVPRTKPAYKVVVYEIMSRINKVLLEA